MTQGNNPKFCNECGAEIQPKDKFCAECGTSLVSVTNSDNPNPRYEPHISQPSKRRLWTTVSLIAGALLCLSLCTNRWLGGAPDEVFQSTSFNTNNSTSCNELNSALIKRYGEEYTTTKYYKTYETNDQRECRETLFEVIEIPTKSPTIKSISEQFPATKVPSVNIEGTKTAQATLTAKSTIREKLKSIRQETGSQKPTEATKTAKSTIQEKLKSILDISTTPDSIWIEDFIDEMESNKIIFVNKYLNSQVVISAIAGTPYESNGIYYFRLNSDKLWNIFSDPENFPSVFFYCITSEEDALMVAAGQKVVVTGVLTEEINTTVSTFKTGNYDIINCEVLSISN